MTAITIWQPWASLIACGAKKYETRSWATGYRGPLAIHAATKPVLDTVRLLPQEAIDSIGLALSSKPETGRYGANDVLALPRGAVVATSVLVGCWRIAEHVDGGVWAQEVLTRKRKHIVTAGNEGAFGDWTPGRYAWELQNVEPLALPVPTKGAQKLWEWMS